MLVEPFDYLVEFVHVVCRPRNDRAKVTDPPASTIRLGVIIEPGGFSLDRSPTAAALVVLHLP